MNYFRTYFRLNTGNFLFFEVVVDIDVVSDGVRVLVVVAHHFILLWTVKFPRMLLEETIVFVNVVVFDVVVDHVISNCCCGSHFA